MLDVAISLPRFLFQGTVSLIRERWQFNIIRGESQRSGGGLERPEIVCEVQKQVQVSLAFSP